MILRPGTYLQNRYEIIEQIGSGGMSEVYKAKCHKLNRLVAIKVLKEEFCSDESFVKKFKMEAQAAASLSHPNIVNVYDVVDEENLHYIVMELIEGITLKSYIAKKGHLESREATEIAIQVALGIGAAHERHIIHRDVKPQNMILSKDGKVKVADFGIARAVSSQTSSATAIGSVHYISPEQAQNKKTDERSDIYSLGITIYEMVTGRLPFDGDTSVSVALAHLEETMTPPHVYNPDIPLSLEQIIMKCAEKDPDSRYQNITELVADLRKSMKNPDASLAGAAADGLTDGDTIVISKKDMNRLRSAGSGKKNGRTGNGRTGSDGTDDGSGKERGSGIDRMIAGVGITVAILIAAGVLFLLLKFSGMLDRRATASNSATTAAVSLAETESITDKQAYMPYVIGLTQEEADAKLKSSNLQMTVSGSGYSEQFAKNMIMEQDPEAGTIVSKYSKVSVKISLGSNKTDLTALGLAAMTGDDAEKILKAQGFTVQRTEEFSDTVETGKVIRFDPQKAEKGAAVSLVVSKGKETAKAAVPNITGLTEEAAIGKLTDAHLKPGKAKEAASDTVPKGTVIGQDLAAGAEADENSTVGYTVSSGPQQSTAAATVESLEGNHDGYRYVASIDSNYNLSDIIGPGSNTTSFKIMVRLKQEVNGSAAYKTLMEPRTVTGDTILPIRFKTIEGAYGVDTGEVEVVRADNNTVLQSYEVQFFKVQ